MKIYTKTVFIVLALILFVILTLSACKNNYSIPPESEFNTTNNFNSVYIVTEKREYTTKEEFIQYKIVNNSDTVFSKSKEDFVLQKYEKNSWKNYSFKKDRVYTYDFYEFELSKNESTDFRIIFKNDFDIPMDKGYYRIIHFGLTSNIFNIK